MKKLEGKLINHEHYDDETIMMIRIIQRQQKKKKSLKGEKNGNPTLIKQISK